MRLKQIILLSLVICISFSPETFAVAFEPPAPISNKEKIVRNIPFTGSGLEEEEVACGEESEELDISKDFSLGTDPKERRVNLIKAFMSEYGLSPEQAAGPVGNFMEESGGDHLPPDVNQGDTKGAPPNSSSLGYGWAQWSGSRKSAFANFLRNNGYLDAKGHATDAGDFAYMKKELTEGYKSTITELNKQTSPERAALSFHTTYEKSGDNMAQIKERATAARQAFNEYKASDGAAGVAGDCGATANSVTFGEVSFPLKGSKKVVSSPGMFKNGTTQTSGHPYIAYDIMSPGGTPVRAFITGKVSYFFNDTCGGDSVTIWNEKLKIGISYMHFNRGDVIPKMGQEVKVGEVIGKVGAWNGGCGGDHLHIDASTDKVRQACSRSGCSIQSHFRKMGKELHDTFQALPDN